MNTLTFEGLRDLASAVLLAKFFEKNFKAKYASEGYIELATRTTTVLEESSITAKEELLKLLKNRNIIIKNEHLFYHLLKKLYQDEIQLILHIVRKLLNEDRLFHIEVYETEGDLEDLYFVIHYGCGISDEYIEEDIFNLNEYIREIGKDKTLWFLNFASEIGDV